MQLETVGGPQRSREGLVVLCSQTLEPCWTAGCARTSYRLPADNPRTATQLIIVTELTAAVGPAEVNSR